MLNHKSRLSNLPRRRGLSLLELAVAVILLGVVFAGMGPMFSWIRTERRLSDDRQMATLELANQAERLSLWEYDRLTVGEPLPLELSPAAAAALPGAVLTARVEAETEPAARRVTLELAWPADGARTPRPLRLVQWHSPPQGGTP